MKLPGKKDAVREEKVVKVDSRRPKDESLFKERLERARKLYPEAADSMLERIARGRWSSDIHDPQGFLARVRGK